MEEIVVIGGGGHAKVLLSVVRKLTRYHIVGYTDPKNQGGLLGTPYLGTDQVLESLQAKGIELNAVIGVGQVGLGRDREKIERRLSSLALRFPNILSPHAIVNEGVSLAESVVVMDGVVINSGASIGRGAILNTNSTVEHDCSIGEWVHVAPGSTISGGVTVGRFSMIGAGATIIEGKQIASDCIVGAGATVVHDLIEPGVYVGCPARRIR
jgi:sugar O-acyltransferase (sialic acid O-acetyltransferase NeuD family)